MRKSGILMHISSLSGKFAIGTLGSEAYNFVDMLSDSGVGYWQILPIGPTGFGNSPYQSFSSFAGNSYLISPELLVESKLISREDAADAENQCRSVDYEWLYKTNETLLKKAFSNFTQDEKYIEFKNQNSFWLNDYSLFMSVKRENEDRCWLEWDNGLKFRNPEAINTFKHIHNYEIEFWNFVQYIFFEQWTGLKNYANSKNIKIIGDAAIYVALDSCDVWSKPQLFQLDDNRRPICVAGSPPDFFSEDGQLWGNPLYDWDSMSRDGYRWWIDRLKVAGKLFDSVRIDHFRGFSGYWSIPYESKTAASGCWKTGPGAALFEAIKRELGSISIIAEDLGMITDDVRQLLDYTGYPGMKVLQFAFEKGHESSYLPFHHTKNCICYTGTHDNDTLLGWIEKLDDVNTKYVYRYTHTDNDIDCSKAIIDLAWSSRAKLCIVPMQDLLMLGSEARMNTPSTSENNWTWRISSNFDREHVVAMLRDLNETFFR